MPPEIRISSTRQSENGKEHFNITFADNGIGFESEFSEKIFETFARLNPKDAYEGTGLGLALCKRIVERRGTIRAKSKPNEGVNFTIMLPKSPD